MRGSDSSEMLGGAIILAFTMLLWFVAGLVIGALWL